MGNPLKSPIAKAAETFGKAGLITAVASDGHRGVSWRPITGLADAREAITELAGPGAVQRFTETGPAAILAGERLAYVTRADTAEQRRLKFPWRR